MPSSSAERRAAFDAKVRAETGIDEAMIAHLVDAFYDQVRADPLIGPIFEERIADWPTHLEKMRAFWSSVALMSGRYHGQPMAVHQPMPVDARHFDRWLDLWEETARTVCPPRARALFVGRARRIAASLEAGVAVRHGVATGRGERTRAEA